MEHSNWLKNSLAQVRGLLFIPLVVSIALSFMLLNERRTEKLPRQIIYEHYLHAHYKRLARSIDQNSVVFLGSSTIQALPAGEIVVNSFNLGIGGEKLAGLHHRVTEYKNIRQAKLVVLAAGFNDLCSSSQRQLASQFRELVKLFPEKKPILISALQPAMTLSLCADFTVKLQDYNKFLHEHCKQRINCKFLDLPEEILLASKNENLSISDYFESDQIHLNQKGYDVWQKKMQEYTASIVSN